MGTSQRLGGVLRPTGSAAFRIRRRGSERVPDTLSELFSLRRRAGRIRSSELPFCCKRGHSAILPSHHFPSPARSSRCECGPSYPKRRNLPAGDAAPDLHTTDLASELPVAEPDRSQRAWDQFRARTLRLRRDVGNGRGRTAWAVRRDRVEASDGLIVVVDLATSSAIAAGEMKRRQPMTTLASSPVRRRR